MMKDFSDFIESSMSYYPKDEITFRYKKRVYDSMVERVKEVKSYGLKDENVAYDLIVDENNDIVGGYHKYLAELKEEKTRKNIPVISGIYVACLLVAFFFVGFVFDLWHPGWLIVEGGITILIIGILMFIVSRLNRTKWYPVSRALVAASVMIASQFIFLMLRIPFHIMDAYLIFLAAPALMFLCDLILANVTHQKLVIINYLICIPIITIFIYAILGIVHVIAWDPGWYLIVAAFLADIAIVLGVIINNRRHSHKPEVEDTWKEN